jgi:hypothetical protein
VPSWISGTAIFFGIPAGPRTFPRQTFPLYSHHQLSALWRPKHLSVRHHQSIAPARALKPGNPQRSPASLKITAFQQHRRTLNMPRLPKVAKAPEVSIIAPVMAAPAPVKVIDPENFIRVRDSVSQGLSLQSHSPSPPAPTPVLLSVAALSCSTAGQQQHHRIHFLARTFTRGIPSLRTTAKNMQPLS